MKERIKKLRKTLDITQQEFAQRIGSVQNSIASYEIGRRLPSNAVIDNICKTFNVDETWLRTGKGDMFRQDGDSAVDRLCAELHADELEAEIIRAYFRIDEKIRLPFLRRLIQEVQGRPVETDTTGHERTVADAGEQKRTELARIAAERKAGQEQMEVAEELLPDEQEELDNHRREIIAKRGQTAQPSALPNASAS